MINAAYPNTHISSIDEVKINVKTTALKTNSINKHSKINKKQNKTKNTRKNNQKQEDSDNSKKGIGLFNKLFKQ